MYLFENQMSSGCCIMLGQAGKIKAVKRKEITTMTKYERFPVADLNQNHLQKVQLLEKELRQDIGENIVLIAYDEGHEQENK